MNVFLLYQNRDAELKPVPLWNEKELTEDLEMNFLFKAMSIEDEFLFEAARVTIFSGLKNDFDTIIYRQEIGKDGLNNPSIVRSIYDLSVELIESGKHSWYGIFTKYPSSVLSGSIGMMEVYLTILKKLRIITDETLKSFIRVDSEDFFL